MSLSTTGNDSPVGSRLHCQPKLNTTYLPIVNQYREGKVKSSPMRAMKQYLKPLCSQRVGALCVAQGNYKKQETRNKQIQNIKSQTKKWVLNFENWNLRFVCILYLGIWIFACCARGDGVLFVERANESKYTACLSPFRVQAQRKQVLIAHMHHISLCSMWKSQETRNKKQTNSK